MTLGDPHTPPYTPLTESSTMSAELTPEELKLGFEEHWDHRADGTLVQIPLFVAGSGHGATAGEVLGERLRREEWIADQHQQYLSVLRHWMETVGRVDDRVRALLNERQISASTLQVWMDTYRAFSEHFDGDDD